MVIEFSVPISSLLWQFHTEAQVYEYYDLEETRSHEQNPWLMINILFLNMLLEKINTD